MKSNIYCRWVPVVSPHRHIIGYIIIIFLIYFLFLFFLQKIINRFLELLLCIVRVNCIAVPSSLKLILLTWVGSCLNLLIWFLKYEKFYLYNQTNCSAVFLYLGPRYNVYFLFSWPNVLLWIIDMWIVIVLGFIEKEFGGIF